MLFEPDPKLCIVNELKSWLDTILLVVILYCCSKIFFSLPDDKLFVGLVVILILKIGDTLTEHRIKEIRIENQNNQLCIIFNSVISGPGSKSYNLHQLKSELSRNSFQLTLMSLPLTLKIFVSKYDILRINSRHGISAKTLNDLFHTLKTLSPDV